MAIFKNIIVIAAIGLAVLFAGCAGTQETKIAETAQPTPAEQTPVQTTVGPTPAVQTSGYQLLLEVKTLQDCIVSGTKQVCSQVNLDVKNNNPQSLDVAMVKNTLVLKDGRSLNMYNSEGGLSSACVRKTGLQFKLSANTNQNLAMCYPLVHKSDTPTLNIGVMMNGERKDYSFDLTTYGLTD